MSRHIHPIHAQFSRQPPTNTIGQLLDRLARLSGPGREYLLMAGCEAIDSVLGTEDLGDSLESVLESGCRRLATRLPEDVVVRQVVGHMLWTLLNSQPERRRVRQRRDEHQLTLFSRGQERAVPPVDRSGGIYEEFCAEVVRELLAESRNTQGDAENETLALLALCELRGIGYWTLRKLARNGMLRYLFHLDSREEFETCLRSVGAHGTIPDVPDWRTELFDRGRELSEHLKSIGVTVLQQEDPLFPPLLRSIDDPPLWLFVQGDVSVLHKRCVAVVGTRRPSSDGMELASTIGGCLPGFQSVIVSGLADGIDQVMHIRSLRWKVPTIAVLGTGILSNYPSGSEELRERIYREGGAIITEYLPRDSYSAKNFVRRNRIQAGLSNVVVPVEWKEKSGTAHTVRYAYEAKRRIVCPRLASWRTEDHGELKVAVKLGAKVFTLPEHKASFVTAVRNGGVE